jgi:hypothetical protein
MAGYAASDASAPDGVTYPTAMPAWLTTLMAAFLGGFLSLAGVWMQLRFQHRREELAALAEREAVFARVLGVLHENNPDRAQHMLETQEPLARGADAAAILGPLRDSLASAAGSDLAIADEALRLVELLYAYFDALPGIDHWEGDRAVITASVSDAERRAMFAEAEGRVRDLLARRGK